LNDTDDLLLKRVDPPNAETPLARQRGLITPSERFYVRCNFPIPPPPAALSIDGLVGRPLLEVELGQFKRRRLIVTLECAANGRAYLEPPAPGEQWELGAVSTAEWEGVILADVLEAAGGVAPGAVEVRFDAADGYARSLPLDTALLPTTLLVTHMNGQPLPPEHGAPVRLVVPRWYGMAAVKWLTRISPIGEAFTGHFQVEKYVIGGRPVREMEVRAVVTGADAAAVHGYAWSGHGNVVEVSVTVDAGSPVTARLDGEMEAAPYGWIRWTLPWSPAPGERQVVARARDSTGRLQPLEQVHNALGYCNNAARTATIRVRP